MPKAILILDGEAGTDDPPAHLGERMVSLVHPFRVGKAPRRFARVYEVVADPRGGLPTVRARMEGAPP